MPGSTSIFGLPYPLATEAPNGASQIQALANGAEAIMARTGAGKRTTGTQSIPNNTLTALTMDTELVDHDTMVDLASHSTRITVQHAGLYHVSAFVQSAYITTPGNIVLSRNGGAEWLEPSKTLAVGTSTIFGLNYDLVAAPGDYFEVSVSQASGGAIAMTLRTFCVALIGPGS